MLSFMSVVGGGMIRTVTVTESKTKNVYSLLVSDKQEIAHKQCEIAKKKNANVPFLKPNENICKTSYFKV